MRRKDDKLDIFGLMVENDRKNKIKRREALLSSLGIKDFFPDGQIIIDKRTCKGLECKICIKVCPTNALYWIDGIVGITEDLCVYCGACVLNCMVDDCIKVTRIRKEKIETFSTPSSFIKLQNCINSKRHFERIKSISKMVEDRLKNKKIQN